LLEQVVLNRSYLRQLILLYFSQIGIRACRPPIWLSLYIKEIAIQLRPWFCPTSDTWVRHLEEHDQTSMAVHPYSGW